MSARNMQPGGHHTYRSALTRAAFREGVDDYLAGLPPRPERRITCPRTMSPLNALWTYERGRLLAAYATGLGIAMPALKGPSGRVSNAAYALLRRAHNDLGVI